MPSSEKDLNSQNTAVDTPITEEDEDDAIETQPELQPETEVSAIKLDDEEPVSAVKHHRSKKSQKQKSSAGIIVYLLSQLFSKIYRGIRNSGFACALTSYDSVSEAFRRSFLYSLIFSEKNTARANSLKTKFRKATTEASVPKALDKAITYLLSLPTRMYGLIFFLFGVVSLISHLVLKATLASYVSAGTTVQITGFVISAIAILLTFSNDTLVQTISESKLLSSFLYGLLGIKRLDTDSLKPSDISGGRACLIGIGLGILSIFFPVYKILLLMASFIYAAIVIKSPESGMISLILLAPFAPLSILKIAIILLAIAYIYKALCGKRTIKFEFSDIIVALFLLTVFSAETVSFGGQGTPLSSLIFILSYFIAVSILRSDVWFSRAVTAIVLGASAMAVGAVVLYFIGEYAVTGIFADFTAREYRNITSHVLLYTFFIMLTALPKKKEDDKSQSKPKKKKEKEKERKKGIRLSLLFAILCSATYLTFALPPYALLAAITALSIFAVLCNVKTVFPIIFLGITRIVLSILGVGGFIIDRISTDKSSLIGSNIMIRLLSQFGFIGVGSSENADMVVGSSVSVGAQLSTLDENSLLLRLALELGYIGVILFALSLFFILQGAFSYGSSCPDRSDKYRLTAYAGMCGLIAAFICGIWENIWIDPRMPLIYWLLAGVTAACTRCSRKLYDGDDPELAYINRE